VIRSAPSPFTGLLEGGGTVLARTVTALENVNKLLSPGERRRHRSDRRATSRRSRRPRPARRAADDLNRTINTANQAAREIAVLANAPRA
jgi:phospholipid/cholesterol/gamma-HCH transport system substrate-binding protein